MSPTPTIATGGAVAAAATEHAGLRRVVRANPRTDRFHALSFHHVELWCASAASAAGRFSFALGAPLAARSDLSTGNSAHASLLLRSGSVAFLFTAPYAQHLADAATASVPSFSAGAARSFAAEHGLAVRAVAVRVADAAEAFRASVDAGALPAFAPTDLGRGFGLAEVELYGDVVLRFVSYPDDTGALFLPGFENVSNSGALDYGLRRFDHIVGNVPELAPVAAYIAGFTGFHEFAEFTAEDVGTAESGLNSVVLANNSADFQVASAGGERETLLAVEVSNSGEEERAGGMGGGVEEERQVVDLEDWEGEEGEEAAGSSRETRMLPRMPVRVLLAEGDDSTRHIISALLRKCGYRVAAASDGVKAWGILKEKSFNIDLVLTEVELPLMSGFLLLSTIMEHDACKNIPVIMMSSHDSVSTVFKCMLKGAADFLVKPIRKNELRNLWQHVWRKQLANGGPDVQHTQQEENLTERHEQKTGVTKAEHLIENVAGKIKECSEQESDAQSSCTRSELEAESKHTNNFLEYKQTTGRHFSTPDHTSAEKNGQTTIQTAKDNNLIPRREGDLSPRRTLSNDNNCERASSDIELVHIADNQQKHNTQMEVDIMRTSQGNDDKWFSIPAHQLELSLRRSDYSRLENQDKNELKTLNHSTSSAFSLYNCRTASSIGNAGDAQTCSTSAKHADLENKLGDSAAPSQDKTETNCPPIRVVPFPVPVGGLTFDGQPFWNGAPVASLFYPHSAPPIWNSRTSMWQEATTQATLSQQKSQQSDTKDMNSNQVENTEEQTVVSPNSNGKHLHIEIPTDELRHVSPVTGESGSSTVLDSARNTLGGSGCDSSSNVITAPTESSNTFNGVPEITSTEGLRHLSQREAALNKFRLKRKERCFEKKVRYQSRKLLAEQRPRVKGQFVRQDHSIQGS